jgi:predicted flap endonuclease-1-like 5' DNA nuclease
MEPLLQAILAEMRRLNSLLEHSAPATVDAGQEPTETADPAPTIDPDAEAISHGQDHQRPGAWTRGPEPSGFHPAGDGPDTDGRAITPGELDAPAPAVGLVGFDGQIPDLPALPPADPELVPEAAELEPSLADPSLDRAAEERTDGDPSDWAEVVTPKDMVLPDDADPESTVDSAAETLDVDEGPSAITEAKQIPPDPEAAVEALTSELPAEPAEPADPFGARPESPPADLSSPGLEAPMPVPLDDGALAQVRTSEAFADAPPTPPETASPDPPVPELPPVSALGDGVGSAAHGVTVLEPLLETPPDISLEQSAAPSHDSAVPADAPQQGASAISMEHIPELGASEDVAIAVSGQTEAELQVVGQPDAEDPVVSPAADHRPAEPAGDAAADGPAEADTASVGTGEAEPVAEGTTEPEPELEPAPEPAADPAGFEEPPDLSLSEEPVEEVAVAAPASSPTDPADVGIPSESPTAAASVGQPSDLHLEEGLSASDLPGLPDAARTVDEEAVPESAAPEWPGLADPVPGPMDALGVGPSVGLDLGPEPSATPEEAIAEAPEAAVVAEPVDDEVDDVRAELLDISAEDLEPAPLTPSDPSPVPQPEGRRGTQDDGSIDAMLAELSPDDDEDLPPSGSYSTLASSAVATEKDAGRHIRGGVPSGTEDDLMRIPGVTEESAEKLRSVGVLTYAQLAMLDIEGLKQLASALDMEAEELRRLGWVDFARQLMGR